MSEINDIKELTKSNFPINLKLMKKYQRTEPILMDKYKDGTYHMGSFHGGSNIDINLIKCKDKIVIPSKLQSYLLRWYHMYLLNLVMDRTEAIICQHFYWPDIRDAVQKEVTNCDIFQYAKRSNTNMVNYELRNMKKHHGTNCV